MHRSHAFLPMEQGYAGGALNQHKNYVPGGPGGSERHAGKGGIRWWESGRSQMPFGDMSPGYSAQFLDSEGYALHEDVRTRSQQGVGIRAIARRLKLSRQTVRRFIRAEVFPEIAPSQRANRECFSNAGAYHLKETAPRGSRWP